MGKIIKSAPPSAKIIAGVGSKTLGGTLSSNSISQNSGNVNGQNNAQNNTLAFCRSYEEMREETKSGHGTTYYLEAVKGKQTLSNKQMIKVGTGDIPIKLQVRDIVKGNDIETHYYYHKEHKKIGASAPARSTQESLDRVAGNAAAPNNIISPASDKFNPPSVGNSVFGQEIVKEKSQTTKAGVQSSGVSDSAFSNTSLPQGNSGVNSQSMQNGEENAFGRSYEEMRNARNPGTEQLQLYIMWEK